MMLFCSLMALVAALYVLRVNRREIQDRRA
jgi:hypothetical protein